ncbi:MAG: hypothetical protein AAF533_17065 [Acidobacteriota bacterium]
MFKIHRSAWLVSLLLLPSLAIGQERALPEGKTPSATETRGYDSPDDFRFHLDGREIGHAEFLRADPVEIVVGGTEVPEGEPMPVLGFSTEEGFLAWAIRSPHADGIQDFLVRIKEAQRYEEERNQDAIDRQSEILRHTEEGMRRLSATHGLDLNDRALLDIATDDSNPLVDPVLKSVILYNGQNYACNPCRWLPTLSFPNLGWFNMNNRASSYRQMGGIALLCDRTWFRGPRVWFIAFPIPFFQINDLGILGFDNRASSIIH